MLIVTDRSGNGMGIGFVDRAQSIGQLTGVSLGTPAFMLNDFNASLSGVFVATVQLVRSYNNGLSYQPLTALGSSFLFTAPCEEVFVETEPGVLYAWQCISYTSGTIKYRISQ